MKGHSTEACWAKKIFFYNFCGGSTKHLNHWVLIKYPCLFYNQMDIKLVDCLRRSKVKTIFLTKPPQIMVSKSPHLNNTLVNMVDVMVIQSHVVP
jgi:hypothetical protein